MKFKMLSITELSDRIRKTVSRFSLLAFFLCVGAVDHLFLNIYLTKTLPHLSRNIFMSLLVLVPVLFSIRLFYESGWIRNRTKLILNSVSVIAAVLYCYYLPSQLISLHLSLFSVLFIISILFCFVCVKQGAGDDDLYWQFYVALFVRLVITGIYTLIIIGGTSAALGAVDLLFKTNLLTQLELRIVILTLWIFTPLFFLSGVPLLSDTEEVMDYKPRWLKNIGIYIMIPLTVVYLGILYAYGAKILFQWQLPEGTVSYLVLSFAAFGIVSLLVIFPFQKDENSKWCYRFSRYFYFLQIPLLALLFNAIFTRVFAYGVTFRRYYVLALAIWLLFITVFMIIRKNRNIIIIPFSLLVIAVLSIFGPWSSFNVSYMNQRNRLLKLLNSYNLIANDKLVAVKKPLPLKVRTDISSIAAYLYDYGKLESLAYLTTSNNVATPESFTEALGFKSLAEWNRDRNSFYYYCSDRSIVLHAAEYDFFIRFRDHVNNQDKKIKRFEAGRLVIEFLPETAVFQFIDSGSQRSQIKLEQIADHFKATSPGNNSDCCNYVFEDKSFKIYCLVENLAGWEDSDGTHFSTVNIDFFVKRK